MMSKSERRVALATASVYVATADIYVAGQPCRITSPPVGFMGFFQRAYDVLARRLVCTFKRTKAHLLDEGRMRIAELAKRRGGVSTPTLRYYEEEGLLRPAARSERVTVCTLRRLLAASGSSGVPRRSG